MKSAPPATPYMPSFEGKSEALRLKNGVIWERSMRNLRHSVVRPREWLVKFMSKVCQCMLGPTGSYPVKSCCVTPPTLTLIPISPVQSRPLHEPLLAPISNETWYCTPDTANNGVRHDYSKQIMGSDTSGTCLSFGG